MAASTSKLLPMRRSSFPLQTAALLLTLPVLLLLVAAPSVAGFMEDGFTDGVDGGRYSLWQDEPKPADEVEAKKAAEDVKCGVCEVILGDLLKRVGMLANEDNILNVLEGEASEAEVQEALEQRDNNLVKLSKGRKGCNRHFKDSYLRLGWDVEGCKVDPPPGPDGKVVPAPPFKTVYGTCTKGGQPVQNETKMNTYSMRMEAIYWACQLTVGSHMDGIASFVAKKLKNGGGAEMADIVKEACDKKAKCTKLKFQGDYKQREKEVEKKYFEQQNSVLESVKALDKQKKSEAKKSARRGRRKKDAEL